jgi:hypothetical protein
MPTPKRAAPWERPAPKKVTKRPTKHLSPAQKEHAAQRAKRAGRSYPNLVDNMHEAEAAASPRKKAGKKASKKAAKRTTTRKKASKKVTKKSTKKSTKKAAKRTTARKKAAGAKPAGRRLPARTRS